MTETTAPRDLTAGPERVEPPHIRPLRVWPAIVLLIAMPLARIVPQLLEDGPALIWMIVAFGPALLGILILLWWLLLSRATWVERLLGFVGVIALAAAAWMFADPTIQGPAFIVIWLPIGIAAFALTLLALARRLSIRRAWIALAVAALAFGSSSLAKAAGVWGDFSFDLSWRWKPSTEQQFLASETSRTATKPERSADPAIVAALEHPEWPGFRGGDRTSRQTGTELLSDWTANPPRVLWKVPVGPAWSSFAVAGDLLFTQEQLGENESVVCYDAKTGQQVWRRQYPARFDDALGGTGPRATPTIADGDVFVLGADGLLMRLGAQTGEVRWERDLKKVAERDPQVFGFSSSPLVIDGLVIVHAGGSGDKGTLAFDAADGALRWSAPSGDHSYCSPHLVSIDNRQLVLILTNHGLDILVPASGAVLLKYDWPFDNYRALQPQLIDRDSILIATGMGAGTRRIQLTIDGDQVTAHELWTSRDLKPDFNDFVIVNGFLYGFDGAIFSCIDASTGKRKWKGGRYGKGQVLLVANSNHLLVLSETGELVLLDADSTKLTEPARFQALEGKTWNHPVLIGDRLYVRNSQQAACIQLPVSR